MYEEIRRRGGVVGTRLGNLAVVDHATCDQVLRSRRYGVRPEQVGENAAAAGVTIPLPLMERIDDVLGDVIERDPARTEESSPKTREA